MRGLGAGGGAPVGEVGGGGGMLERDGQIGLDLKVRYTAVGRTCVSAFCVLLRSGRSIFFYRCIHRWGRRVQMLCPERRTFNRYYSAV